MVSRQTSSHKTLKMASALAVEHPLAAKVILRTPVTQMTIFTQGILLLGSKHFVTHWEYCICKLLELSLVRKGRYKL